MQAAVFFFSFANDEYRPLANLTKEKEAINEYLSIAIDEQAIQVHNEVLANIDNVSSALVRFHNRLRLFHYSGHASQDKLGFNEQSANADGIAYQLAQHQSLKLVFLNGCSTHVQVKLLLELGIPAVIATTANIEDEMATTFAKTFYQAIAKRLSIRTAFESAAAVVQTKTNNYPRIIYRDTILRENPKTTPLAWGLYVADNAILEAVLLPSPLSKSKEKNIVYNVNIDVEDDIHIGDQTYDPNKKYDRKNIVKDSTIKSRKGGFRLGDG